MLIHCTGFFWVVCQNSLKEQNGSEEGFVSIHRPPSSAQEEEEPVLTEAEDVVDQIEMVQEQNLPENDLVQIATTMEFVNREVYGEEDKIKEILVEVSSGFNFLAPADDLEDFDEGRFLKIKSTVLSTQFVPQITRPNLGQLCNGQILAARIFKFKELKKRLAR